jgi:Histone methylation protein DOT1
MLAVFRYLFVFIVLFFDAPAARAADAPYVTTPQNVIDAMLTISAVTAQDYLIDLGSGDGRIVITAAKTLGARGMGVELDANLVRTATRGAQREGVQDRVSFISDDLFFADLSKATVITVYMSEAVNLRLRPSLLKLKPGTRVVSHDFNMGSWQPDGRLTVSVPGKRYGPPSSEIFLWRVPADFSGRWVWRSPVNGVEELHEAALMQKFQHIEGKGAIASRQAVVGGPKINGDAINFAMGAEVAGKATWREFQGRISGDTITGTAVTIADADKVATTDAPMSAPVPWRATRTVRGRMDIEADTAQPFGSGFFTKELQ